MQVKKNVIQISTAFPTVFHALTNLTDLCSPFPLHLAALSLPFHHPRSSPMAQIIPLFGLTAPSHSTSLKIQTSLEVTPKIRILPHPQTKPFSLDLTWKGSTKAKQLRSRTFPT